MIITTGYRANEPYTERNATAYDVLCYEKEDYGNVHDIFVADDQLKTIPASTCQWVCLSRKDAEDYGEPHQVDFPVGAFVLACDLCDPLGYYVVDLSTTKNSFSVFLP